MPRIKSPRQWLRCAISSYRSRCGLQTTLVGLSPEIVLFAGDIVAAWPYFSGILAEELPKTLDAKLPRIITTADCGMARLRGALALVLQQHFIPASSRSPAVSHRNWRVG